MIGWNKFLRNRKWFGSMIGVYAIVVFGFLVFFVISIVVWQMFFRDTDRMPISGECRYVNLAIANEANAILLPHVDALNAMPKTIVRTVVRANTLDSLTLLPGVVSAFCLVDGKQLEADRKSQPSVWLRDSLTAMRTEFYRYPNASTKYRFSNRCRTAVYHRDGKKYYLIADVYDSTGTKWWNQEKWTDADSTKKIVHNATGRYYLIALLVDENWLRTELAHHFERAMSGNESFLFWSVDTIQGGAGIVSDGDTLWWHGLRTIQPGIVTHVEEFELLSNSWFHPRTIWNMGFKQKSIAQRMVKPMLAVIVYLLFTGAIISALLASRKLWLSRQLALEQFAHAIKTPVARMRLSTDMLIEQRAASPEHEQQLLASLNRECSRLEMSVQNAALALEEGEHKLHFEPVDLRKYLTEVSEMWLPTFEQIQIPFTVNIASDATVPMDRNLFGIALDNILDNALRHTRLNREKVFLPGKLQVMLSLTLTGSNAVIAVTDSGAGIPPQVLKTIFHRFERSGDRALSGVSGLGIGLAIAQEIVASHKGTIVAENCPEGGARFIISLPLKS